MSSLELRNVRASTTHTIDPEGVVFGREAGTADIVLADRSVSKKHARIYQKNGKWFLEDLGSSNGTFFDGRKISGPVALTEDAVFSVAAFTFEVLKIDQEGGLADDEDDGEDRLVNTATNVKPVSRSLASEAPAGASARQKAPELDEPAEDPPTQEQDDPEEAPPPKAGKPAKAAKPAKGAKKPAADDEPVPEADEAAARSVGYYLAALPRGIAYHLAAVPLLVLNPMGTVRKAIENQPLPAMKWPELIVYALPANLFSAAVGFICTLIFQLIKGTVSIGSIIPIGPLIGAVLGSVIGGLICHPVLTWIVDKLKGESDAKARSNFYVQSQSAVVIAAIPSGLSVLLAALPIPFIAVVPALLSLASSLIFTLISYRWFTHFNVVKWFRQLLLALGALAVLGTAINFVQIVVAGVKSFGSSSSSAAVSAPEVPEAKEEEEKEEAKADEDADEKKDEAKAEDAKGEEKKAEAAANSDKEDDDKGRGKRKGKKADKDDEPAAAAAARAPSVSFAEYASQREAVEKAIAADPTLLKKDRSILSLYEKLHRVSYDVRSRSDGGGKKKKKGGDDHPGLEQVRERLKDAEVYEATAGIVSELHSKISSQ